MSSDRSSWGEGVRRRDVLCAGGAGALATIIHALLGPGEAARAESQRGGESRRVLVDFGFTPTALNNNIDLLAVEPSQLNALVLSHGHYDHFGGREQRV